MIFSSPPILMKYSSSLSPPGRHGICPKITPPDFKVKNFTPSISPYFNSFSEKTQKMSENGEIYSAGKKFTLPPAVKALTNFTSGFYETAF